MFFLTEGNVEGMYEFEFAGFTKEQCDAYLERIGAEYDGNPTLENLNDLIFRNQSQVPFENLAVYDHFGTVNLDPDALFRKIVIEKRGGFCFELNGAFTLLLKGLGYDVVSLMARVGIPFIGKLMPLYHRAIQVAIDGKDYYCDVGMGGPKPSFAVPMSGEKASARNQRYWIEDTDRGWKMLKNDNKGDDGAVIIFAPIAFLPFDFYAPCQELLDSRNSIFHMGRMVNLTTEDGFLHLDDKTLTIRKGEEETKRDVNEAELPEVLKTYFGIEYR